MTKITMKLAGTALTALALASAPVAFAAPAAAQSGAVKPSETLNLSQGTGTLVQLPAPMNDVFIANEGIADVQVRSSTQLYVFGKARGETTVYATGAGGRVVYAANVRVGNNVGSLDQMLDLAMPEAEIQATPMNNLVLLTGTVASPDDAEQAERLVQAYVGTDTQVVSRLRQATPLQVNLRVRIAEVNRTLLKEIGLNLLSQNGSHFGIAQGEGIYLPPVGDKNPVGAGDIIRSPIGTTLSWFGNIFGSDFTASLDLAETDGLVTTLAEPNLTALSGETASFLAGGEFPIPVSEELGKVTIEYKEYGVGLAFTPWVLANGRISMRVRPEVSELTTEGSIKLNGFEVPGISTRRAETTVELGSGQSFMIAGLLRNSATNSIEKAPVLGDLPIIGALFRSTKWKKNETELVIIVTPYLVRPVSNRIALPTDGYRAPTDAQLFLEGREHTGRSGSDEAAGDATVVNQQPVASSAGSTSAQPGFGL